jgi:hypothetical protein
VCLFAVASPAWGAIETFHTSASQFDSGVDNQGWWSATRGNLDSNDNYFTGEISGDILRSFFSFDLTSLSGTVVGAELTLRRFRFDSADPTETLGFFDVSTPATTLNNNEGTSATIFDDLGTGVSFGTFVLPVATTPEVITFTLNAAAIAAINGAQGGFFSIGGSLLSLDNPFSDERIFFFSSDLDPQMLTITTADNATVPEPLSVLVWVGLASVAGLVKYRRGR